jgi:hypothetical protein
VLAPIGKTDHHNDENREDDADDAQEHGAISP